METEGVSLFQSGVWLIPLFLVVMLALLFWLVRRWRDRIQADLKAVRSELRQMRNTRRELDQALQGYAPDDPEPYGQLTISLQQQLQRIDTQIHDLELELVRLHERASAAAPKGFPQALNAPKSWYQLRSDALAFSERAGQTWQSIDAAAQQTHLLERLSWQVAQKARQVSALQEQAHQLIDQLRQRGLHGAALEDAAQVVQQTHAEIQQIPIFFLSGDQNSLLQQADKASASAVHGLATRVEQTLQPVVAQASEWQQQFSHLTRLAGGLQRALQTLERLLTQPPPVLNVVAAQTAFQELQTQANQAHSRVQQPAVEQLETLAQQAGHITESAQKLANQLAQAYDALPRLATELADLQSGLKKMSLSLTALSSKSAYPVAWSKSSASMNELNQRAAVIGAAGNTRTPEQALNDLQRAAQLNEQLRDHLSRLQQLEIHYGELHQILTNPEISNLPAWLAQIGRLSGKVGHYAPENWPRQDAVRDLPAEVQALGEMMQQAMPAGAIPEDLVPQRLEDSRRLAQAYHNLQKRVESIHNRLTDLEKQENQVQERLREAQTTVNQVALLVGSNPFLSQLAAQELERFKVDLQNALQELEQRQRGSLEKKARSGEALIEKIEQSANRWLDQLNQEIQTQAQALAARLKALDEIATLEDQPVYEARRVLSARPTGSAGRTSKAKFRMPELTPEFKRRSDYWQSCTGASKGLEDIAMPVIDSFDKAAAYRQQSRDQLSQAAKWLHEVRQWPPTAVSLDGERQELDNLDKQWQVMKDEQKRGIHLVQQLEQLAARYYDLGVKIDSAVQRAEQEMTAIEQLEAQIHDLYGLWQENMNAYRDDARVVGDIRALLEAVERENAAIKRQYRQQGRDSSYGQVMQNLKALERKVRYFLVDLDADHALDVQGNVSRRR